MTEKLKPMKAADLAKLWGDKPAFVPRLPKLLSPKVDGYRCMCYGKVAFSSNATPIVNKFTQWVFGGLENLDGELVVGSPTAQNALSATQSGMKRADGEPSVHFYVFDDFSHPMLPYEDRLDRAAEKVKTACRDSMFKGRLSVLPQIPVKTLDEVLKRETEYIDEGYEGVMLRNAFGTYKFGRSSVTEDDLWKLKRFVDGEGVVIGVEEAFENTNEMIRDELGRAKRSGAKAGKTLGKGMVGTIIVQDPVWGTMRLSPGVMPHSERVSLWAEGRRGRTLIGLKAHWRAFGYGVKEKPRFARYYGVRFDV